MGRFDKALTRMFVGGKYPLVGRVGYAAARTIDTDVIELSWYPNLSDRFHEVKITLPRDQFVACVDCRTHDIKTRLFVKSEWLRALHLRVYSTFVLVDAIGIKRALRSGGFGKDKIVLLRKGVDRIADKNKQVAFISFADSLLIKANWRVGMYNSSIKYNYQPEALFGLLREIKALYKSVAGLEIYSVLAQGHNEYPGNAPVHISRQGNHLSMNSLGLPFAQLLAIDTAVRTSIKAGTHGPAELYMDEDFYFSLRFDSNFDRHAEPNSLYTAPMRTDAGTYYYGNLDRIISNLDERRAVRHRRKGK